MLKLQYFLVVTLYFQLFNVECVPVDTVGVVDALLGLAGKGCWPRTINSQQVLGEFHQKMK